MLGELVVLLSALGTLGELVVMLSALGMLGELHARAMGLQGEGAAVAGGAVAAAGGLRRPSVADAAVGLEKAPELVALLCALGTLEEVDVERMQLQRDGVAAVVCALPTLPKLHAVNVSENEQSAADVEAVVPLLAAATGLQRLVMHEEAVEDLEAVRRAVERAAPWLTDITLGAAHELEGGTI
eukprot:jgi/Ulvmu1/1654/UM114_0023.1